MARKEQKQWKLRGTMRLTSQLTGENELTRIVESLGGRGRRKSEFSSIGGGFFSLRNSVNSDL